MKAPLKLYGVGMMAVELRVIHKRVEHAIRELRIEPVAMMGHARLFDAAALEAIRSHIAKGASNAA